MDVLLNTAFLVYLPNMATCICRERSTHIQIVNPHSEDSLKSAGIPLFVDLTGKDGECVAHLGLVQGAF